MKATIGSRLVSTTVSQTFPQSLLREIHGISQFDRNTEGPIDVQYASPLKTC